MAFKRIIEITSESDAETVVINNLYMSFVIDKNATSTPNKGKLTIYNLSDSTAAKVGKAKNKLTISAGYEDEGGAEPLFYGDVAQASSGKTATDKTLEIEAFDGLKNTLENNITLSYETRTSDGTILQDIIKSVNYPLIGTMPSLSGVSENGFSFIGKTKKALDRILDKNGYKWSIQNKQLYIYQEDNTSSSIQELLLSYDTGLLQILPMDRDSGMKGDGKELKGNFKIVSLIFPQLVPGARVRIDTPKLTGSIKLTDVKLAGANFGGVFQATSIGIAVA